MVRKGLFGVLVIFLSLNMVGCAASRRYTILESKKQLNKKYTVVEVGEIKNLITRDRELLNLEELRQEIIKRLEESKLFTEVKKGIAPETKALKMEMEVVSFEKGNRVSRYMIGYGAGKSFLTVKCTFIDKETGDVLSVVNFDGELSMGMFGGSYKNTYTEVAASIVEYLKDVS